MVAVLQRVSPYVVSVQAQIVLLVTAVTILSAFVKNIGALAMMIPIAFQMARRSSASPSCFLMPMAFGSLLGGLITLVGTSPNIIVSRLRAEMTGQPFGMFDFTPVGLGLAVAGVAFLAFGYRLLPGGRRAAATMDEAIGVQDYMTEARVTPGSTMVGKTVRDLAKVLEDEVTITGVVRNKTQRQAPLPDAVLREGDIVLLEGEPQALERAVARSHLELEGEDRPTEPHAPSDEIGAIEAVVGPTSVLVGQSAGRMTLHARYNVNLLAVSRKGQRFTERLRDITLRPGDLLVLKGNLAQLPERLKDLGCLPLTEREIRLGNVRRGIIPLAVLGGAMGLTAFGVLPVAIAFFAAATLMIVLGALSLREAYPPLCPPSEGGRAGDQRAAAALRAGPARRSHHRPEQAAVHGPVVPSKAAGMGDGRTGAGPGPGARNRSPAACGSTSLTMRPCASATKPFTRRCTCKAEERCTAS